VRIAACLKRVDTRPEVDLLTGAVHDDPRTSGASPADQAALEWALRCAEAWGGEVLVVSAGPASAEAVLREALAAGAARAVRVDLPPSAPSEAVAAGLADALDGVDLVWCGDYSLDRGSASVPAYLAGHLQAAQALGLVGVELALDGERAITALRRLDGGRRERLLVRAPAVLSVEGSTARLRRASLAATIAARSAALETVPGPVVPDHAARVSRPFRPRPRVLPAPAGASALDRIVSITGVHTSTSADHAAVALDPKAAAQRIVDALREWGELDS
jgi:electron transfer flavoprotein beta subunit